MVAEIYAPGDEVELFLNGRSVGRKAAGKTVGFITHFELAYEPGRLEAVAREKGVEIGRMALETAKGPKELRVEAEEGKENELVFVPIAVTDQQDAVFTNEQVLVKAAVEGALEAWMGTGNPKPLHNYTELETETWNGRAQLILRRRALGQRISVVIEAEGRRERLTV